MRSLIVVREDFAAAHLYFQSKWSHEQNLATFGACYSEYGHGHNYRLEVGFQGDQALADLAIAELQAHVRGVADLLEHKHLNFAVPEFREQVPTLENIATYFLKKLQERCPSSAISYIKVFETETLWVEIAL